MPESAMIITPTRATDGEGHKKRENRNIVTPRSHQVRAGVFITFDIGSIRRRSLPRSAIHLERAVTSAIVAMISINSLAAYKMALNTV